MNTCQMFYWVMDHPNYGLKEAQAILEITPQMVDPVTKWVDLDHPNKNTELNWWIEVSRLDAMDAAYPTHFIELDCGGVTIDDAIKKLYELTKQHYGEY